MESSRLVTAILAFPESSILLLDTRMPGVSSGRLLATLEEEGIHRRSAIALIAEQIQDAWIARLREGVIDDIVPRHADASAWRTHLSTMQRGHALYRELEYLRETASLDVRHDRVTGCYDRETTLRFLFRETDRVQRLRTLLSVMVVDIDNFGHWNQEFGRDACDGLLREVAVRLGHTLRSYDLLGRLEKDSFALILPGCGTIDAGMLADRIRFDVFSEPFYIEDPAAGAVPVQLTASYGVALPSSSSGRLSRFWPRPVLKAPAVFGAQANPASPARRARTLRLSFRRPTPSRTSAEWQPSFPVPQTALTWAIPLRRRLMGQVPSASDAVESFRLFHESY
jgi:diguanylate cyclase (GGDEF)-like protein